MTDLLIPGTHVPPSAFTQRVYDRMPDLYRADDTGNGLAFLAYVAAVGDIAQDVATLFDRFNYNPYDPYDPDGATTCDLCDPATADASWLAWLAQLLGIRLDPDWTIAEQRAFLAADAPIPSTVAGIIAAAQAFLTGTKTVEVEQYTPDQWHYTVTVSAAELGVSSYGHVEDTYPTYGDLEDGFATYGALEGNFQPCLGALESQVPAGMTMLFVPAVISTYGAVEGAFATYGDLETAFFDYGDLEDWTG